MATTAPPSCSIRSRYTFCRPLDLVGERDSTKYEPAEERRPCRPRRTRSPRSAGCRSAEVFRPRRRKLKGLVKAVGVQALRAAEGGSQALHRHPDDVVRRVDPRLGMEAQHLGALGPLAPEASVMMRAGMRRAAGLRRLLEEVLCAFQNDSRGAKASTSIPAAIAAST